MHVIPSDELLKNKQAGVILVEAALVIPLLLAMVFVLFSFAQVAYKKALVAIALQEVARSGERSFASHDAMANDLRNRLENLGVYNATVSASNVVHELSPGFYVHMVETSFDVNCLGCGVFRSFNQSLLHQELRTYYIRGQG